MRPNEAGATSDENPHSASLISRDEIANRAHFNDEARMTRSWLHAFDSFVFCRFLRHSSFGFRHLAHVPHRILHRTVSRGIGRHFKLEACTRAYPPNSSRSSVSNSFAVRTGITSTRDPLRFSARQRARRARL